VDMCDAMLCTRAICMQLLTWASYSLATNAAAQSKLRDEIAVVVGSAEINMETVKHMPYLQV
jgi:hypothetical protein